MKKSHPAPSQRPLKVGEELRHVLAETMQNIGFLDPDLERASITVTEVRIGPDLKNATVYVMTLGGKDLEKILKALNRNAKRFRHEVARNVRLKFAPALKFEADTTFDYAERINSLIQNNSDR